jgi:5-amino-6-(5-phosphoribosylamino)uracil reductase
MITFVEVEARNLASKVHTTVVLAMSVDGKIADFSRGAARFGSSVDKLHLERQIAQSDGVLFGAGTLRAYGTTLRVSDPDLIHQRQQAAKPLQPVQIVVSRSANLNPNYRFFQQPVPRWLLTTTAGAKQWQQQPGFERLLVPDQSAHDIDWQLAFEQLAQLGIDHLAVLGGGELVASLLQADLIDEFKFTLCPLVLGGVDAPTSVEGKGFLANLAPRLRLRSAETIDHEVFLHYELCRNSSLLSVHG